MLKTQFKKFALIVGLMSSLITPAFSAGKTGGDSGGGGDASEARVNEIRSDILTWLKSNGPLGLKLTTVSYDDYVSKMTDILQPKKVIIGFVEQDDDKNPELQVTIKGVPKTCRGFYSVVDGEPHILCNILRFSNTSASQQYSLIHHEYAGLVNLEKNSGAASDYSISSQLTDFLRVQPVLKLAVVVPTISLMGPIDISYKCSNPIESLNLSARNFDTISTLKSLEIAYPKQIQGQQDLTIKMVVDGVKSIDASNGNRKVKEYTELYRVKEFKSGSMVELLPDTGNQYGFDAVFLEFGNMDVLSAGPVLPGIYNLKISMAFINSNLFYKNPSPMTVKKVVLDCKAIVKYL